MTRPRVVKDIMSACAVTVASDQDVLRAIEQMPDARIQGAPVVDEHRSVVGVLSQKDCLRVVFRAAYQSRWHGKVAEYMNREVGTLNAEANLMDVPSLFLNAPHVLYPVVDNNRLVGEVSYREIVKTLLAFEPKGPA
jgi:CBS domain-containing protein